MPEEITLETEAPSSFFQSATNALEGGTVKEIVKPREQQPEVIVKPKDDSAKELRQQRDNLKKEKEQLEAKIKDLEGKDQLGPLKSVQEYIKKKFGKEELDEETVNSFITHNKKRKEEVQRLTNKDIEKENRLKEINITLSQDYQEKYSQPWTDAENNLLAVLCPVDNEGNPKNIELINALKNDLLRLNDDKTVRTPIQTKAILSKFAKIYEARTQEPYVIPSFESVTNGVTSVMKKAIAANKAKADWTEEQKKNKIESEYKSSEARKETTRKELEGRNFLQSKLERDFKYKELDGVFTEDEIKSSIKGEHEKFTKMFKGEQPGYTYDQILELSVKASQFNDAIIKVRELEKQLASEKKKRGSGLPGSADRLHRRERPDENEEEKKIEDAKPSEFFQTAHSRVNGRQ